MVRISMIALMLIPVFAHAEPPRPFLSKEWDAAYRAAFPAGILTDAEMTRAAFYDEASAPPQFQFGDVSRRTGFHSPYYNQSGTLDIHGNANREFPWRTGGTDNSPDASSYKAIVLPAGQPIRGRWATLPSVVGMSGGIPYSRFDTYPSMVVEYPIGTKAIEVITVLVDGVPHVFEVRTLEKVKAAGIFAAKENWRPRYFRPVRDRQDLRNFVGNRNYAVDLDAHYPKALPIKRLVDGEHTPPVFDAETVWDELPEMPVALRREALRRPFADVTDVPWVVSEDGKYKAFAASGGPFPRRYQGAFFSSKNCLDCHATTLRHANDFKLGRDWYGRTRGADGILSVPLADDSVVSYNGFHVEPRWNGRLLGAGLLKVD